MNDTILSLLQQDGDPWFGFSLSVGKDMINMEEVYEIIQPFGKSASEKILFRFMLLYNETYNWIRETSVKISPNSWYHQCTAVNTRTGQIFIILEK